MATSVSLAGRGDKRQPSARTATGQAEAPADSTKVCWRIASRSFSCITAAIRSGALEQGRSLTSAPSIALNPRQDDPAAEQRSSAEPPVPVTSGVMQRC